MREKLVLECPNAAATLQYSIYYICRICKNLTASTVHNLLGKTLRKRGENFSLQGKKCQLSIHKNIYKLKTPGDDGILKGQSDAIYLQIFDVVKLAGVELVGLLTGSQTQVKYFLIHAHSPHIPTMGIQQIITTMSKLLYKVLYFIKT